MIARARLELPLAAARIMREHPRTAEDDAADARRDAAIPVYCRLVERIGRADPMSETVECRAFVNLVAPMWIDPDLVGLEPAPRGRGRPADRRAYEIAHFLAGMFHARGLRIDAGENKTGLHEPRGRFGQTLRALFTDLHRAGILSRLPDWREPARNATKTYTGPIQCGDPIRPDDWTGPAFDPLNWPPDQAG